MNSYRLLIFLLSCTALVDAINGALISFIPTLPISFGQIFRFILLMVLIFYISSTGLNRKQSFFLLVLFIYFLSTTLMTEFNHSSLIVLLNDITYAAKLLLPMLIIVIFKRLSEKEALNYKSVEKILEVNLLFITISMTILKILNLGQTVYEDGIGFKGFYYSNNELSIVLGGLFIYSLDKLYTEKSKNLKYLIYILLLFETMILIGAKTSYIIIIVATIIYLIKFLRKQKAVAFVKLIPISSFIVLAMIVIFNIFKSEIMDIYNRQKYFLAEYSDFTSFILSNRNSLLEIINVNYISPNMHWYTVLVGFRNNIIENDSTFISIELDLHSIYFNYGFIGLALVLAFYGQLLKGVFTKNHKVFAYKLTVMLFFLFSALAGHVFFGAFANTFLAIFCIPIIAKMQRDDVNIKSEGLRS